jgi:NAD(P)-dependent dehydrogenase (short-subunit alcohol dehydrogenase family)
MGADGKLAGRAALVTGAGQGIGKAIAAELARKGAQVVVADSGTGIDGSGGDPSVAEAAAAEIGAGAIPFAESIASPSVARTAVETAAARFGALDIVVNNAAIVRDAFVFEGDPGDWEAVLRNNLSAAYYLLVAATPLMRDQANAGRGEADGGWGRVVNIVSTAGFYGNYGQSAYASAKGGLMALTRTVALDMERSGVTCNAVAPFAATRVTDIIQPANQAQAEYKTRALKLSPDHVATLVAYLRAPAARAVSGQLFGVRGREIFLFSQPRPVSRIVREGADRDVDALAAAVEAELAPDFVQLASDLELFNTEPYV